MVRCESNKLKDINKRTESCKSQVEFEIIDLSYLEMEQSVGKGICKIPKRKYESSKKKMKTKKSGRKNSVKKLFSSKNTTDTDFDRNIPNDQKVFEIRCRNLKRQRKRYESPSCISRI